tara:strand:+ start:19700 stop:20785 length:1086 start_codon:yes stop_codon:yes gene_type:complete
MQNNNILAKYFLVFLLIICVILIAIYINRQITKKNKNNKLMKKDLDYVENYVSNLNVNDAKYQHNLRDYYIMSSYNSCCNGNFENGYVTTDALKTVIKRGARVLDFEIYSVDGNTVIAASDTDNYYQKSTYNSLPFGEVMNIIENYAFSASTAPNFNDPLILHFRIKSTNDKVFEDMANVISSSFSQRRLSGKYNYESGGENIGAESIKNFLGKVIIVVDSSNKKYKETKLDELVNFSSGTLFLQSLRDYDVRYTPSSDDLINSNKKNMAITMPDIKGSDYNIDPSIHFKMGCQCVCMNFQSVDTYLIYYLEEFNSSGSAFILKPESLRYIPLIADNPKPQDKSLSYAPKELKKPYFRHVL